MQSLTISLKVFLINKSFIIFNDLKTDYVYI